MLMIVYVVSDFSYSSVGNDKTWLLKSRGDGVILLVMIKYWCVNLNWSIFFTKR